jgi:hypothetical protein
VGENCIFLDLFEKRQANRLGHNDKTWDCRVAFAPRNDKVRDDWIAASLSLLAMTKVWDARAMRYGGMPEGSAGLPRRYAPRNDKRESVSA